MDRTERTRRQGMARLVVPALSLVLAMGGPSGPRIRIHDATLAERRLVAWAIERYRQAGLVLPSLDVEFRPTAACGDTWAYFDRTHHLIVDCLGGPDTSWVPAADAQDVLLHEMAHAWDAATMRESVRRRFLTMRGLTVWRGPMGEWRALGSEQAAEIIAWGLMDEGLGPLTDRLTSIFQMRPDELTVAFRLLTGRSPLHGASGA